MNIKNDKQIITENRLQKFVNRIYGKKTSPVKLRNFKQQVSIQQVSKEQQYEDVFEKRINELYMNSGQPSQRETSRIRAQVEEEVIQSFRNPSKRGYSLMDSSQHVSKYYQVLDTKREQMSSSFLIRRSQPNLSNSKEQKPKREQLFRRVNSLLSERKVRASVYQNQINYHQNIEPETIDVKQKLKILEMYNRSLVNASKKDIDLVIQ
ncbi:hypothetical protein pb186bvf_017693 [Paramecium bursaria]